MFKKTLIAASIALIGLAGTAQADLSKNLGRASQLSSDNEVMPPKGYTAQWWTHPKGCEYSRAGRPGETVWFLIINSARKGCPSHIVQNGFGDVYSAASN